MIKNFRHVCIVVKDLDRSLKFYRYILGLKVAKIRTVKGRYPESALKIKGLKLTYVKLRTPNQSKNSPPVFELHYWQSPRILPKSGYNHLSFTVENLDEEYKRLKRIGLKFISPPVNSADKKTKICFGYDPDRHLIEFVQELKTDKR